MRSEENEKRSNNEKRQSKNHVGFKERIFSPSIPVCEYQQELKCFELYNGKRENEDVIKR